MAAAPPVVNVLRLRGLPILRQLQLEEAMLRAHAGNWLVLNDGAPQPAVVLGISSKPEQWVDLDAAAAAGVQVLRRYSGGGTVIVDEDTLFATLVMAGDAALPGVGCYPRPVMSWSEGLYRPVFGPHGDFRMRDNDYVFGDHKFGGNAQAISRGRWVHHTSLLWDWAPHLMGLLRHPPKTPQYRQDRPHTDFVTRLRDWLPDRGAVFPALEASLGGMGFRLRVASLAEAELLLQREHLRSTRVVAEAVGGGIGAGDAQLAGLSSASSLERGGGRRAAP